MRKINIGDKILVPFEVLDAQDTGDYPYFLGYGTARIHASTEMLERFWQEAGGEKAEEPAKAEPLKKPRRKIDIGKIMALREAGWTYLKIADEMGMTSAAVAQAVYMYKRKHERNEEA